MKSFFLICILSIVIFSCERKQDMPEDNGGILTPIEPTDFWETTGSGVDKIGDGIVVYNLFYSNQGNLFAGTDSGIYRTVTDGGKWKHNLNQKISVLDFIEDNSHNLFAATVINGVYLSNDAGVNWTPFGLTGKKIWCLIKNSNGEILAGTESDGVFKLNSDSNSWDFLALKDTAIISFEIDKTGKIYAGTYGRGVLRSENNGRAWVKTKIDFGIIPSVRIDSSNVLYISNWGGNIFKSVDSGKNVTPGPRDL